MWEKCVSCGEGLFAGDAFCGNCGRPTTSTVPAAREPASGPFARPGSAPDPARPVPAGDPAGPPQLELGLGLGLGLAPALDGPADPPPALDGLADPAPALDRPAEPTPAPDPALDRPTEPAPVVSDALAAARPLASAGRLLTPAPANDQLTPAAATGQPDRDRPRPAEDAVDPLATNGPLAPAPEATGQAGPGGHPAVGAEAGPAELGEHPGTGAEAGPAESGGHPGAGPAVAGHAGLNGQAGPGEVAGLAGPDRAPLAEAGQPGPEMLIIPARQVDGPAGPGGRLTVPAQRRGQPGQLARSAGAADRTPHRTRLTGQANLDPGANSRLLLRVGRQAALFAGIYALTETVLLLVFLGLGFTAMSLHSALRLETDSLWLLALILASLFWVIPVPALLGQWSVLVENSADASRPAFEHIATAFREHDAPLDSLAVRPVAPRHESARDYLELRRGRFSGFISCFPHGRDLHVGWTFFLRMSPARLVLLSMGRSAAHLTRRGGDVRRALWSESTRALVAAMHSATLAGIATAVSAPDAAGETASSADDVVVKFG